MKVLSAMTNMLLIITLYGCAAVKAEDDSAGGNNEPVTEQQVDPATPKTDQKTEPKPETKPATGAAEPGCS